MIKNLLFLGCSMFICVGALAQHTITGTVSDEKGNMLPGANILLKGTNAGTVTDADGKYTLSISSDQAGAGILSFSFIG